MIKNSNFYKHILLILIILNHKKSISIDFLTENSSRSQVTVGTNPKSITYSSNGKFVAVANSDSNSVSVFTVDDATGELKAVNGSPFTTSHAPISVKFAPNNNFAAVACNFGTINIFMVNSSGKFAEIESIITSTGVTSVAYSPNGNYAAVTNSNLDSINIYKVNEAGTFSSVAGSPFPSFGKSPQSVTFSPDSNFLAIANSQSNDISIHSLDQKTGYITQIGTPVHLNKPAKNPLYLAYSSDGKLLAVADGSGHISMFEVATNGSIKEVKNSPFISGGTNTSSLAFSSDNKYIVTANSGSNNISAFTVTSNGQLTNLTAIPFALGAGAKVPQSIAYHPNNNFLAIANSGSNNISMLVFDKSKVDTSSVKEVLPVNITAEPSTTINPGTSVTLTANAFSNSNLFTYLWQPGDFTTQSISVVPTETTVYNVEVTDQETSKTAIGSITISLDKEESAETNKLEIQETGTTEAPQTNITDVQEPATETQETNISDVQEPTTETQETNDVTINANDPITVTIATNPNTTTLCQNGSIILTANATGGSGNYSYVWNTEPIQTTKSVIVTTPATYTVTVTDENMPASLPVSGTSSIGISSGLDNSPTVKIASYPANATICQTGSITLIANAFNGSGNYSFFWQGPNNFTSTEQTLTLTNSKQSSIFGQYTVIAIDNSNECASLPASITVKINESPTVTISSVPDSSTICISGAIMLIANATGSNDKFKYEWNTGQTSQAIFATSPGTYSVTVTDVQTGCASDTPSVQISTGTDFAPTVSIVSDPNPPNVIIGSQITLTAVPNGGSGTYKSFNWILPDGTPFIGRTINIESANLINAGTYQVIVVDSDNCGSAPASIRVNVVPAPAPTSVIEKAIRLKYCS